MALGGAQTPHLDRAGNENQDRDDAAANESVAALPTANVYYKYPLQKNDLSREVLSNYKPPSMVAEMYPTLVSFLGSRR